MMKTGKVYPNPFLQMKLGRRERSTLPQGDNGQLWFTPDQEHSLKW